MKNTEKVKVLVSIWLPSSLWWQRGPVLPFQRKDRMVNTLGIVMFGMGLTP